MIWIFIAVKKQILNLSVVLKFADLKWTKTIWNEVVQPTTGNNDSRPVFPYHVHNQADFDNPFNGRVFICLGTSKMSVTF